MAFQLDNYKTCKKCNSPVETFIECQICKDKEHLEGLKCPVCKSEDLGFNRSYENNGIIGPGFSSWPISESVCCKECGILFLDVRK